MIAHANHKPLSSWRFEAHKHVFWWRHCTQWRQGWIVFVQECNELEADEKRFDAGRRWIQEVHLGYVDMVDLGDHNVFEGDWVKVGWCMRNSLIVLGGSMQLRLMVVVLIGLDGVWSRRHLSGYDSCWVCTNILEGDGGVAIDGGGVWLGCMGSKD